MSTSFTNVVLDMPVEAVQRSSLLTRDQAVATAVIERLYAGNRFTVGRPDEDFTFQMTSASAGPLLLSLVRYSFQGHVTVAAVDTFTTVSVHAGSMAVADGDRPTRTMSGGQVWRWSTEADSNVAYSLDSTFLVQQLPFNVIDEAAAQSDRIGTTPTDPDGAGASSTSAAVHFLDSTPLDAAAEAYWTGLVHFAYQQATATDCALSNPLIRTQLVSTLAQAALVTFPNTTMTTDYLPGPGEVGSATLRRAVAYLHAHAEQPITVGELAAAAGIGVRALQQAFIAHLGVTPMAHLRRVRLERAHYDLRAGDATVGDSVAAIATRWGFAHPGRFAAAYQARYDLTPASTLRS